MAKYNVGDKVRIVSERVSGMNDEGRMDKWLGQVMTINEILGNGDYGMKEDAGEFHWGELDGWSWDDDMIECKVEDAKLSDTEDTHIEYKVGDKVRIINHRNWYWNCEGEMDQYMGKVMTIKRIAGNDTYFMEEAPQWAWGKKDFECKIDETTDETNKEERKMKFKVGDKVKANELSNDMYAITTLRKEWIGEVVEVYDGAWDDYDDDFRAITTHCKDEGFVGDYFDLNSKFFDLVEKTESKPAKEDKPTYNVGDKVKIREDLEVGNCYGTNSVVEDMEEYRGAIATITEVYGYTEYLIDLDEGDWFWTPEMFECKVEDVESTKKSTKYQVGDYVELNGLWTQFGKCVVQVIEVCDDGDYFVELPEEHHGKGHRGTCGARGKYTESNYYFVCEDDISHKVDKVEPKGTEEPAPKPTKTTKVKKFVKGVDVDLIQDMYRASTDTKTKQVTFMPVTMVNLAFVKFEGNEKVYTFTNPTDVRLKSGTRVLVDTKFGEKQATVVTSIKIQKKYLKDLMVALGNTSPLKDVLGTVEVVTTEEVKRFGESKSLPQRTKKVFSKEQFRKVEGDDHIHAEWVDELDGLTTDEIEELGYVWDEKWLVEVAA